MWRTILRPAVALAGVAIFMTPAFAQQAAKRKVAVRDFGYGTVMTSVQALFGSNQDVGRGISDMLIDRLTNDGTFRVIERQELDKLVQEQNFSNSDRADSTSAAKIGRLLGVDAIITGDITQFGRDDRNMNVGSVVNRFDKYGLGNIGTHKAKAVVAITARVIDVNTGEILASVTGKGESKRSGTNLLGGGGSWGGGGTGHLDMGSSNFGQTILGEAVNEAVTQLATQLEQKSTNLPTETVHVQGLVADASSLSDIILNVGSRNGVKVGDTLAITRVTRVIKDPVTGKAIKSIESQIGTVTITHVDEQSADGRFSGGGTPKTGDTAKTPN